MIISVITICFNDMARLALTYDSLLSSIVDEASCLEWVVVDGASTDGSYAFVCKQVGVAPFPIVVSSQRDAGIYDAFNRGLRMASGKYVMFLNCGDKLLPGGSLFRAVASNPLSDLFVFGYHVYGYGYMSRVRQSHFSRREIGLWGTSAICHQSLVVRASLCTQYHKAYQIKGDLRWYADLLCRGLRPTFLRDAVVAYERKGMAARHGIRNIIESFSAFTRGFGFYGCIGFVFYTLRFALRRLAEK